MVLVVALFSVVVVLLWFAPQVSEFLTGVTLPLQKRLNICNILHQLDYHLANLACSIQ